jgi:mannose-1-phosphate guanylyltransferase
VVGEGAVVEGSVVLTGAVIAARASVHASVVGRHARIGEGSVLDAVVVGDHAEVAEGNELPAGLRIACGAVLPAHGVRISASPRPCTAQDLTHSGAPHASPAAR